MCFRLHRH
jgi:hypothetical protein